jgi:hypothetical protein
VGTSVQLIDVVSWSMVIVFALAAMALAWLALFGDKPRGKARCPKCWYELGTLDSPPTLPVTCPECGKRVERPRQLSRRRFGRWTMLAACSLAGVAWIGWKLPEIDERGWLWLVPNRVLYEVLPMVGNTSALGEELQRRAGLAPWKGLRSECTLSQDDLASLLSRAARGNALARPKSQKWRDTYGRMILDIVPRFDLGAVASPTLAKVAWSATDELTPALLRSFKELQSLEPEIDLVFKGDPRCAAKTLYTIDVLLWWPCASTSYEIRTTCKEDGAHGGEFGSRGSQNYLGSGRRNLFGPWTTGDGSVIITGHLRVTYVPLGAEKEQEKAIEKDIQGVVQLDPFTAPPADQPTPQE